MNHIISENLLLFDIKLCAGKDIALLPDSFDRIMKRYELEKGDYENSILSESTFIRLGWPIMSRDIVNSFWVTFTCALVNLSEENTWTYCNISKGQCTDFLYFFDNDFYITYCAWNHNIKKWGKYPLSKKVFGKKYSLHGSIHKEKTKFLLEEFPEFREFLNICDSIANFMPCPSYPYNSVKGCLTDVKDYLNLMVDKIEKCIEFNKDLIYYSGKDKCTVKLEKLNEWKNWFIKNQKIYHLTDYYSIENGKIIGKPLFKNQSLSYPLPLRNEEIQNCVKEMIRRIKNRANSISKDLKEYKF